MIAHVVLFTPRASLTSADRRALVDDLERACHDIPHLQRARIGRRKRLGYAYDTDGPAPFEFAAVLEFESAADLDAYLHHPAHTALGRWFYQGSEVALALDFDMANAAGFRELVQDYTA